MPGGAHAGQGRLGGGGRQGPAAHRGLLALHHDPTPARLPLGRRGAGLPRQLRRRSARLLRAVRGAAGDRQRRGRSCTPHRARKPD
eukprot:scaffold41349_cov54-Phaeocystis_antarctica.AAC.4